MLLAAHAKVLAALSGEQEVATGYVAERGAEPLLCRLSTESDSWRSLLLDVHRVESELLSHQDFPVDDLRRELGLTEPPSRPCFDPTGGDGRSRRATPCCRSGSPSVGGQLGAAAAVPDRRARRGLRRQDRRLPPHRTQP